MKKRLWSYVEHQQQAAQAGEADGQCRGCGAYALDGRPPTLHRHGCPEATTARISADTLRRAREAVQREANCDHRVQVAGPFGTVMVSCRLKAHPGSGDHEGLTSTGDTVRWSDEVYPVRNRSGRNQRPPR